MTVGEKIQAFYDSMTGPHDRDRTWEHCYGYFHGSPPETIATDRDRAALHLGFYLASWGMYRGSSFLLKYAYTAHLGVIDQIVAPRFSALWTQEFGAGDNDSALVPIVREAINKIREAYGPFATPAGSRPASDTLVTKVILGTFGCLPACDRYFIDGCRSTGFECSRLNDKFIERLVQFCRNHLTELREEQARIERIGGMRYPLMKLVDMYFWQIGFENQRDKTNAGPTPSSSS